MKRIITYILIGLLGLIGPINAQKQSVNDLRKQRENTLRELEKTGKMLNETKKSETATLNKLNLLSKDIATRKRLITNINSEIEALNSEMDELSGKRDSLQQTLETLKADYANLVRQTHYQDMMQSPLLFVLRAEDFNQAMRRIRYLQEFQRYRKEQVARIENTQAEIDIQTGLLESNRVEKEQTLDYQRRETENLARDERKHQTMLQQLKKKEKNLLAQQRKQQKKADELNRKIEDIIKQQAARQKGQRMTKEQQLIAGGFEKNKGRLPWPVEKGMVSGEFGVHPHPTLPKVTVNNKGIYIQTTRGAAVRAVYEGEVTSCFVMGGTNAVIIQHGNYRTVYTGLATISVKKGDKVKTKQTIGTVFTDPDNDNKTEMFFQVWMDKDIQNPSLWLAH